MKRGLYICSIYGIFALDTLFTSILESKMAKNSMKANATFVLVKPDELVPEILNGLLADILIHYHDQIENAEVNRCLIFIERTKTSKILDKVNFSRSFPMDIEWRTIADVEGMIKLKDDHVIEAARKPGMISTEPSYTFTAKHIVVVVGTFEFMAMCLKEFLEPAGRSVAVVHDVLVKLHRLEPYTKKSRRRVSSEDNIVFYVLPADAFWPGNIGFLADTKRNTYKIHDEDSIFALIDDNDEVAEIIPAPADAA